LSKALFQIFSLSSCNVKVLKLGFNIVFFGKDSYTRLWELKFLHNKTKNSRFLCSTHTYQKLIPWNTNNIPKKNINKCIEMKQYFLSQKLVNQGCLVEEVQKPNSYKIRTRNNVDVTKFYRS
jgi:hypothetical protein